MLNVMSASNLRPHQAESLKSALRSVTSLKRSQQDRLLFSKSDTLTLANRDYGLMRIASVRVTTPFPRVTPAVDAETLRERLASQLNIETAKREEQRAEMFGARTIKGDAASKPFGPLHLRKELAANPKSLMKNAKDKHNVSDWKPNRQQPNFRPGTRKESYSTRSSVNEYPSVGTPHPKKKIVLNPVNLVKRLTEANIEQSLRRAKRVIIMTPRPTAFHTEDSKSQKNNISFEERRRLFDVAEYTIAKNGKKMSEIPMPEPSTPIDISESIYHVDEQATAAIENYIKIQGLIKTSPNTLVSVPQMQRSTTPIATKSERSSETSQRSGSIISKNSNRSSTVSKQVSLVKQKKTPSSILKYAFHFQPVPSQRSIAFNT
ncbi:uncharacterized protein LOC135436216 [Drosophila montana]|uniref:uncharacterized protein LOC135436216 n=1 Tax=Drosophila montana TaxID=40370 RepID=UPI00313B9869